MVLSRDTCKRTRRSARFGQSTLEYAFLVIIIIGAFIAIQQYLKRGFQGRLKTTVDDFGEQYDPRLVNSITNHFVVSNSDTVVMAVPDNDPVTGEPGFFTRRVDTTHSVETRQSETGVGSFGDEGPMIPPALINQQ